MKPKESDEPPSSDDNSGELVIDEDASPAPEISPMKTRSGRVNQQETTSSVKPSQKDSPASNSEPPRGRSSKIHIDLTPEKSNTISEDSDEEDSQKLSQLSRYEMMERAAEYSLAPSVFKSPKKTPKKSSSSRQSQNLDSDAPATSQQRETRSASKEASPEIPLPTLPESQESMYDWDSQATRLSQLSQYELMERAAEFSESVIPTSPDKSRTEQSPKTSRAGMRQNKTAKSSPKEKHSPRKTRSGRAISDDPLERIEKLTQEALASSEPSENTQGSEEGIAGISVSVSGELLNEPPSDPQLSVSVSGELFNNEPQTLDSTQISQQKEPVDNSSQGSSVYETPEKSLPKTPSKSDQCSPATPPQPSRKLRRSLFKDNDEEPMESPDIIMPSSSDNSGRSKKVETKDSSSQVSGETLRKKGGRTKKTHDLVDFHAEESQEERSQEDISDTQRFADLLNHTPLPLDTQESTQATQDLRLEFQGTSRRETDQESEYATPPTSPTLENMSSTQKTFEEDLDSDYFLALKSPMSDAERVKQAELAETKKVYREILREISTPKPTRDEVYQSVAKVYQKSRARGIAGRLEFATALCLRKNWSDQQPLDRELQKAASWKPKVPDVNFSKPPPGFSTRFKKPNPPAPKPAKEKPGPSSKASKPKNHEPSQPRSSQQQSSQPRERESAHDWSQQALFDESTEDREARAPELDQSQSAPIDRQQVLDFMFPPKATNKRKHQTPENGVQDEANVVDRTSKRSKHDKKKNTPKKSASKPTILKPAVDIAVAPRRPGRDALSEITDLSSAFDNDTPIRGVGKVKQSQKAAAKEKNAKTTRKDRDDNQPTCSRYLTPPPRSQGVDISNFLNSSEDEEVRPPQSRPRRRNASSTSSMPKLTELRSPEKSPSSSKSKKNSIPMKKKHPKTTSSAARKAPRSIASSVETRDPRQVFEEVTITVKDVKKIKGNVGFRLKEKNRSGIYISEIVPGSEAEKAGLRPGDILICFNDVKCSIKSRVSLTILLPVISESTREDFEFVVLRELPDQFSEEEDVDTSEVSDISDAESDVRNIDSGKDLNHYNQKF